MRDVYDHVVRMLQKLEIANELLSSLQSTYLSNISIDVAEASNNVNAAMKSFSAVATIVLPLSLFAGLMGMNVTVPWQFAIDPSLIDLAPFFTIVLVMLCVATFLYLYFRRKDFL